MVHFLNETVCVILTTGAGGVRVALLECAC